MIRRILLATAACACVGMVGCGDDTGTNVSDPTYSNIRIDARVKNATGAIHPKFNNQQFVGILRKGSDSTKIQTKIHAAITDSFEMVFDSLVMTGGSVIVDAFVDTDKDGVFDAPADTNAAWSAWAEPAWRWALTTVALDSAGGHGVQITYPTISAALHNIGDITK